MLVNRALLALTFIFALNQIQAQVSNYTFATSTGAGLDPMAGATQLIGASADDTPSALTPIGFSFTYNGIAYTDFSVTPDGFLKLGSPATTSQFSNSITSTSNLPKVFPMWDDLATGTNGHVRYVVTGTAPNRILKVQWFVTIPRNTAGPANSYFQTWLYEATGVVEHRYGVGGTATSASVGINSLAPVTFHSVTTSTHTSSTTTANNSNTVWPGDGRMYSFTPPPPPALDMGATALVSPPASGCYGSAENVTVTIRNYGTDMINFATNNVTVNVNVTGIVVQSFMTTLTSGTLASGATMNVTVGVLNMSAIGTYTFNANTTMTGDGNAGNNAMPTATRTTLAMTTAPYMEDFGTLTSLPTGWANLVSNWFVSTTHGQAGSGLYINIYSTITLGEVRTLAIGPLPAGSNLKFDTRVLNWSGYPNGGAPTPPWGSLEVQVSTNCGGTYTTVGTFTDIAGTAWINKMIDLSAYAGQKIVIKFKASWTSGDWYVDIDNINIIPLFNWFQDNDGDGFGNPAASLQAATQPPGYVADNSDCDDTNPNVNPSATEVCNNIDDDCDGQVDEGVTTTFYQDNDDDGFGNPNMTIQACSLPNGYSDNNLDCDDTNPNVNPSATEICNNIDDNCNGQVDEGVTTTFYQDNDGDGFGNPAVTTQGCTPPPGFVINNLDCDDNAATTYPGAPELCNNVDDNCNGQVDEGLIPPTWYADNDGDGFGNPAVSVQACNAPPAYVGNDDDCNDNNANINPNAVEVCNNIDDNCNGQVDEGVLITSYFDDDGDGFGNDNIFNVGCNIPPGYVLNGGDCNDANAAINPGATEICNDIDDDCDGFIDEVCNLCNVTLPACKTVYKGYAAASQTTLTAMPSGGTMPYSYAWSNGATTQSITVSPNATTTYTVTLTDAVGCTSTASTLVESVNIACGSGQAQVYICHSGQTQCVLVRLVPGHLAHGDALGPCDLNVCDPYNLKPDNNSVYNYLTVPTGDHQGHEHEHGEFISQQLGVFPNPAPDKVNVTLSQEFESAVLRIFDLQGRVVMTRELGVNGLQYSIPVGELAKGTYLIQVLVDGENFTEKLIVE
jgi:hypothetical protein